MSIPLKYSCPKCGSGSSKTIKIWASGSIFTRIFDIQNKKFNAVVCSNCSYTEFYHVPFRQRSEL